MDANKDQAEELFETAKSHFSNQKFEEALYYFERSKKLYPISNVEIFIEKCKNLNKKSSSIPKEVPKKEEPKEQPKKEESSNNHSPEEIKEIKEIINCKDYYKILGVSKTASKDEIKKAYMKKAMKFHPDRNRCPGAEDAMKNISTAYSCLNDDQKRRFYDQYGTEDVQRIQQNFPRGQNFQQFYPGGPEDDVDEILRSFFQNHFRQRENRQRRRPREQDEFEGPPNVFSWILQFLPLLILIFLPSIFGLFTSFNSSPPFSTQKTGVYNIEKRTLNGNLPYYVKESFNYDWPRYYRSMYQMEHQIALQTLREVEQQCNDEQELKISKIREAQWYLRGNERTQAIEEAEKLETKSCEKLKELRAHFSR